MKAFITGATGFIGSHLIDLLIDKNVEVRCLVRNNEKWLEGKDYTRINGDLHDLDALKKGLDGVDVLYHLAAVVMAPDKKTFDLVNVEATEVLIRLAQKINVKKIVVLSSLAAVGPSISRPVNEQDPLHPVSMYGESKKKMEEIIHKISEPDTSITILRAAAVYGPREEQIYTFFKIAAKGFCPIVGDGQNPRISLVHVRDVVQGLWLAANHPHKGVETYFISSDETYTWNQIMKATARALGKKLIPIHIKTKLVKNLASLTEKFASFFGHYPVFNREKANEMVLEWTCSTAKAKKDLHYQQQVGLEEGILETVLWYKRHHWL
ncbi:MAG TPA: NAD(P)-dependent oxidoreductase [Balneolales bacterium]|nr:NAD(P)-dependent oxidoreductase [Balneolales bacterium]